MIVNPQFFNYRLIIGSLVVAVTLLSVFGFTSYQSIATQQQFLEQEKHLVERELSQMIERYDEVFLTNNLIVSQIKNANSETQSTLDSLKVLKTNLAFLPRLKQQLNDLKVKNKLLFVAIDSLDSVNQSLKADRQLAYNELRKEISENNSLKKRNENLNTDLEKAALITANSFKAIGYKHDLGFKSSTPKAKHANSIEVCFSIAENILTKSGPKIIYIQILDPQNNVISDKGAVNFGNQSLIYSQKEIIDYTNKTMDVCFDIKADVNEQPLSKGIYFISIFEGARRLGGTQMILR